MKGATRCLIHNGLIVLAITVCTTAGFIWMDSAVGLWSLLLVFVMAR